MNLYLNTKNSDCVNEVVAIAAALNQLSHDNGNIAVKIASQNLAMRFISISDGPIETPSFEKNKSVVVSLNDDEIVFCAKYLNKFKDFFDNVMLENAVD